MTEEERDQLDVEQAALHTAEVMKCEAHRVYIRDCIAEEAAHRARMVVALESIASSLAHWMASK